MLSWSALLVICIACLAQVNAEESCKSVSASDLRRAVTKTPGSKYLGQGDAASMSKTLNGHLVARSNLKTAACRTFSALQLHKLMERMAHLAEPQLLAIYSAVEDRRQAKHTSTEALEAFHAALRSHIQGNQELHDVLRDGHCHEAVMMYVHQLTSESQRALVLDDSFVLPLLPEQFHSRPPGKLQGTAEQEVYGAYEKGVSCIVCHRGTNLKPPPASDPMAPVWPLEVAPVMPYQFEAEVVGWDIDSRNPKGTNVTGTWHFDYVNNRMAQYFTGKKSNMRWWPLKTNVTLVWIAAPAPPGEGEAEEIYGKGAKRGTFYAFVKPQPFLPWTCEKIEYPAFSVPRPDAFSSTDINNVTYVGREKVDGKWADHFLYEFLPGGACDGPFNLWKDIYDHVPVKDFGKNDCKGGNASTHWKVVYKREPPLWRWQNLDYSSCKVSKDLDELEERIVSSAIETASSLGHNILVEHLGADVAAALNVGARHRATLGNRAHVVASTGASPSTTLV